MQTKKQTNQRVFLETSLNVCLPPADKLLDKVWDN